MDLGAIGSITLNWEFASSLLSIIFINIILSGDNAVLIAMAVRPLPPKQRLQGIVFGSAVAIVLRIVITFFAAQLLLIGYIKVAGGLLILWVAVKLFTEEAGEEGPGREHVTFMQALRIIVVADLVMSLDNVLAVAAASQGNLFLLIFGLVTSIPLVVCTSSLLSSLMDRFPIIITLGAAILGKVGGEMIITDPVVVNAIAPSEVMIYMVQAACVVFVIAAGKLWQRQKRIAAEKRVVAKEIET
jgi:YjbE family integral membrane protein